MKPHSVSRDSFEGHLLNIVISGHKLTALRKFGRKGPICCSRFSASVQSTVRTQNQSKGPAIDPDGPLSVDRVFTPNVVKLP